MTDRRDFYEARAALRHKELARHYHELLHSFYRFLVPPKMRVLELGCSSGELLAAVEPVRGVGVDFSPAILKQARERHPHLEFHLADAGEFVSSEEFDYILLSDLVNDLPDVQALLSGLRRFAQPNTRLVMNFFNNLWRPVLAMAEKIGAKAPTPQQNWLSSGDMKNLLHLAEWEVIKEDTRILWPLRTPLLAPLANRWLAPFVTEAVWEHHAPDKPSEGRGRSNFVGWTGITPIAVLFEYLFGLRYDARNTGATSALLGSSNREVG